MAERQRSQKEIDQRFGEGPAIAIACFHCRVYQGFPVQELSSSRRKKAKEHLVSRETIVLRGLTEASTCWKDNRQAVRLEEEGASLLIHSPFLVDHRDDRRAS